MVLYRYGLILKLKIGLHLHQTFRELEENVEYHERESEFDIKDEDRSLDGLDYTGSPNKRQRLDINGHMKKEVMMIISK